MKISKKIYKQSFLLTVIFLAIVRTFFLSSPDKNVGDEALSMPSDSIEVAEVREGVEQKAADSVQQAATQVSVDESKQVVVDDSKKEKPAVADEPFVPHKIYSVPGYARTFPDSNDVQLVAANRWGVSPVTNREEAERRKMELVYIGSNPYFFVDRLHSSIPYLVPRASNLLQELGRNFYDSLQVKGIPLHKIIVTSALRTKEDVERLQRRNGNATPNSCHLRGTTFDVSYNRYKAVSPPGEERRLVRNDSLKFVLSEALRDLREQGRCYVKYERKQGCYHITVR